MHHHNPLIKVGHQDENQPIIMEQQIQLGLFIRMPGGKRGKVIVIVIVIVIVFVFVIVIIIVPPTLQQVMCSITTTLLSTPKGLFSADTAKR